MYWYNRLNEIIKKLIQRGYPPTDEAMLVKLKKALEIPSLINYGQLYIITS